MATEEINTALEALSKIDASIAGMQESVKKGEAAQADVQKKIDELGEKQVLFLASRWISSRKPRRQRVPPIWLINRLGRSL